MFLAQLEAVTHLNLRTSGGLGAAFSGVGAKRSPPQAAGAAAGPQPRRRGLAAQRASLPGKACEASSSASLDQRWCRCSCRKSCQADTCCPIRQAAHVLAQGEGRDVLAVCVCVCANNDLRPNLLLRAVTCDSMPLFTPKHLALTDGCVCLKFIQAE